MPARVKDPRSLLGPAHNQLNIQTVVIGHREVATVLIDGSTIMPARVKEPRSLLGPAHNQWNSQTMIAGPCEVAIALSSQW
jgi:hypothetical protein